MNSNVIHINIKSNQKLKRSHFVGILVDVYTVRVHNIPYASAYMCILGLSKKLIII